MRALVTGGAGFIGSHLTDALLELGAEVLVLDDLSTGRRENVPAAASFAEASVTTSESERIIADFAPRVVFHFAAQMDVRRSVADPAFDARANVEGTVRVAGAAARAGATDLIFASSGGAIYGEQRHFPANEDHPIAAESPYGISKRCGELYLDYFCRHSNLRSVALRLANVYGPRQSPDGEAGVVAIFARRMLRRETPTINGDGGQTRDYVFIDDVVHAALSALKHRDVVGPINIGTGIETDVNTLARLLAEAAGYAGSLPHGPPKPGEQRRSVLDNTMALARLHWQPMVNLAEGLQRTVAAVRQAEPS